MNYPTNIQKAAFHTKEYRLFLSNTYNAMPP